MGEGPGLGDELLDEQGPGDRPREAARAGDASNGTDHPGARHANRGSATTAKAGSARANANGSSESSDNDRSATRASAGAV